ncbi:MAG: hypothetical protein J5738_03400 [Lachnospiraceae bacterium]|nr:hypothetical protein [Lachnospiraceae bacterium]
MRRLQQKRSIAKFLCFLLILEMFVASPNVAEASVSKTISKNGREYCAVEGNKQTITVTLASPTKPENTKVDNSSVPGWASVSKPNYNSPVFKVTVQQNNSGSTRVQNIKFTDGTNTWTLTLTQYIYTAPTPTKKPTTAPKPTTKPVTKEPSKKATPVPTAVPSNTPTPAPAETLPIGRKTMQFSAQGGQDTLSLQGTGYSLTFSFPDNPSVPSGWVGMIYDGNTITVKVNKNADYAPRSMKVKITDTKTNQYAYVTINQSAAPTPTPTNKPTPTPVPAETLPVKTKTLNFGAQGGQDTISLNGTGYKLSFSFPSNPSTLSGWVGMVYDGNMIKVKVERNKDYAPRSMKVKITDTNTNQYAYVTINQKAAPTPTPTPTPFLSADRTEIPLDSNGGEESITLSGVKGAFGYEFSWEPNTVTGWVQVRPEGNRVIFTVDENKSINPRTAVITITDSKTKKSVTVTLQQKAMPNTVKVSSTILKAERETISFSNRAEKKTVTITGKEGTLRADRVGDANWFSVNVDGSTIVISVTANSSGERKGYIDVTDQGNGQRVRLTISQLGASSVAIGSTYTWKVNAKGETIYVATMRGDFSVQYGTNGGKAPDWITASKNGNNVTFSFSANKTADAREATIYLVFNQFGRATYQISQDGAVVFNRNYMGAPADVLCTYPTMGENYGVLPSPGNRPGFDFDGWYTSASGGERIGAYTKYNGVHNTLYAHWKVIVSFPDFANMNVQCHETYAQEGGTVTIPSTLIKELESYGFHVSGWTRNPSGHAIDNGNADTYQLPKNLGGSQVSLYAINTEGKTFAEYYKEYLKNPFVSGAVQTTNKIINGAKELVDKAAGIPDEIIDDLKAAGAIVDAAKSELKDDDKNSAGIIGLGELTPQTNGLIMNIALSPPYDEAASDENRTVNEAIVKDLKENRGELDGYINGQQREEIRDIKVGDMTLGQAGCGIIACYNALYGCGLNPSLPELISLAEKKGYLWGSGESFVDIVLQYGKAITPLYEYAEDIRERGSDNYTGFGVNPNNVDEILKSYGVSCKKISSRNSFLNSLKKAIQNGDKKRYIVDYWVVSDGTIYSQHYIYIETTGRANDNTIMICNAEMKTKSSKYAQYSYVEDELTYKGTNLFMVAYEVKG